MHLWLMPVLQRGSFSKVGEIDLIFYLFFLQDSPPRTGHALPFLEPQGLKRIGFKSVQDKCSNLAKGMSFTPFWNTSFALCLPYVLHLALSPKTLTEEQPNRFHVALLTVQLCPCSLSLGVLLFVYLFAFQFHTYHRLLKGTVFVKLSRLYQSTWVC